MKKSILMLASAILKFWRRFSNAKQNQSTLTPTPTEFDS